MAACKVCEQPLTLELHDDDGSDEPQLVPDDLELPCACHFHWQCLLDQATELARSLKCPSCDAGLAANTAGSSSSSSFPHSASGAAILTRYTNEGGVQENYDILPAVTEEAYLEANPEARPARAYHIMCGEGDVGGIVELLREAEQAGGEDEPMMNAAQLIRYQDPLENSKTGLHVAVENGQEEVVWLLLWIASTLPTEAFPEAAVQAAQVMGIQRPSTLASEDIRALTDNQGRTAEALAAQMGGFWASIVQSGALHPGS